MRRECSASATGIATEPPLPVATARGKQQHVFLVMGSAVDLQTIITVLLPRWRMLRPFD